MSATDYPQDARKLLAELQERSLRAMLLIFAVVGGFAVYVTVSRRFGNEEYLRAALYLIGYFSVLAANLYPRIPYQVRAITLLAVMFGIGVVELHFYGLGSMNPPLFLCSVFFAGGLVGYPVGFAVLCAMLVTYAIYAYLYLATDLIPILYIEQNLSLDPLAWLTYVFALAFLALAGLESRRQVTRRLIQVAEGNAELLMRREQEFAERQTIEAALRDREQRYKSLIESTSDAIWCYEFDPPISTKLPQEEQIQGLMNGVLVECNDVCARQYGFKRREDALGVRFADITGRPTHRTLHEICRQFVVGGYQLQDAPTSGEGTDGSPRVFENSAQGIIAGRQIIRVWGSFRDITERHKAEAAREEAQERYRALVRNIPGAVYRGTLGESVQATYLSPWFERITGKSADEILEPAIDFWQEMVYPEDLAMVRAAVETAAANRRAYALEYRANHRDGGFRWVADKGIVLESGDDRLIEGVIFDITARKEAEAAVRRNEQHLLQAQKLEAIGQLAGGIAHDFNNVLQGILGYSEMGMSRGDVPATPAGYFLRINTAAQRAAGIVNQLLAFSRNEPAAVHSVDALEVAEGTAELIGPLLGERIDLRLQAMPHLPRVRCDETQLQQVLLNLALNARDAMPQGGVLDVSLQEQEGPADPTIALSEGARPTHVAICIRDTGAGIPPDVLPHIFEPFFTTKPLNEGTGLGLSTVYGIVTQYGGSIQVESEPGKGSTFLVRLPIAAATDPVAERHPAEAVAISGAARLLFAEDEKLVREAMTQILAVAGYDVTVATDGLEAVELFEAAPDSFDFLLFDVVMPRLNGTEALARIREVRPGIPVMFLTGYSADQVTDELLAQPGTELLSKPVDRGVLLRALAALLMAAPR
ncbi:MAG: response regulator [Candidatus Hydrogenedens sp.]|nr:response regulator [Candidatus Hydrogenedens sp.]